MLLYHDHVVCFSALVSSSESSDSLTSGMSTSSSDASVESSFRPPSEVSRVLTPKYKREQAAQRSRNMGKETRDLKMS